MNLDEEQVQALKALVSYAWEDERKDFLENDGSRLDEHIFGDLVKLQDALWRHDNAEDIAMIKETFAYSLCDECGYDLEDHEISPDVMGKPHAWCKKEPREL